MTANIIIALAAGIFAGYFIVPPAVAQHTELLITIMLCILLFFVGVDIGHNKSVFRQLKKHGSLLLAVPLAIIAGSTIGGLAGAWILGMPVNEGLAIASGYGWYSLSGVLLTRLHGADLGTIAFLTNITREVLAILTIPFIAKYINHLTTIAPAGATSMDVALPLISSFTTEEVTVIAFVNGAILSSLVPILVPFFYAL